jgi:hypothetical protein
VAKSNSGGLLIEDIPQLKELLTEARRTYGHGSDRISERFVEIRPGLVSQLLSRSHHVIQGRRGTGKSTVLRVLSKRAESDNVPVVIVDMEQHKHRHYPDVLVDVLIDVLSNFPLERKGLLWKFRHDALSRQIKKTIKELRQVLQDPDILNKSVARSRGSATSVRARLFGRSGLASGEASSALSSESTETFTGGSDSSKIERLRSMAPMINRLLSDLVLRSPRERSLVFIDDYYFISTEEQPLVLDYLHGVCKGTGVWLKVGGVGSRLKLYQEGDPPVGVQVDQDVSRLKLDVTLEEFVSAKAFLEKVLNGILLPSGYSINSIMNEGARNRIVLASGGAVPRDYINLILESLDVSLARTDSSGGEVATDLVIQTEDINLAARRRTNQKEEEDLRQDAGIDAPTLRQRWQDIQAFANDRKQTNFVLFRQGDLTDTDWGREVQQLENLRLLHRIGVAVPNTNTWRQIRVVIFMIDLAAIMNQRLGVKIVEFWKGQAEFDKLRRAQWVYEPGWKQKKSSDGESANETLFSDDDGIN